MKCNATATTITHFILAATISLEAGGIKWKNVSPQFVNVTLNFIIPHIQIRLMNGDILLTRKYVFIIIIIHQAARIKFIFSALTPT